MLHMSATQHARYIISVNLMLFVLTLVNVLCCIYYGVDLLYLFWTVKYHHCMSQNTAVYNISEFNLNAFCINVCKCVVLYRTMGLDCYTCLWVWFCPLDRYTQNKFMWLRLSVTCHKKTHRWYNGNMSWNSRLW